ncbi:MAG: hypothetical protein GX369_01485 [Euryarchaeota archaeon]|nr:hypothetical protein [Euryarchaeota archaeon]
MKTSTTSLVIISVISILVMPASIMESTTMGADVRDSLPISYVEQSYEVNLIDYLPSTLYDPNDTSYQTSQLSSIDGIVIACSIPDGCPEWVNYDGTHSAPEGDLPKLPIDSEGIWVRGTPSQVGVYTIKIQILRVIVDIGIFEEFFRDSSGNYEFEWIISVAPPISSFTINMLAGDTFSYTATTSIPSLFTITSGTLSKIGLDLDDAKLSGTAKLGKETIVLTATSNDGGPPRYASQEIKFNVYRMLDITSTLPAVSWAGETYSTEFNVTDVDPDSMDEVALSLNDEAIHAGYILIRNGETKWTLSRNAAENVEGDVDVKVIASTNAGNIPQSKSMSTTITTYENVGFISEPTNHKGPVPTTVWLVEEDNNVWTYTPAGAPADVIFSASNLPSGITFSDGELTVPTSVPIDEATITITAKSCAGGTEQIATQAVNVKVWPKLVFTSEPTIHNIETTVDGRTITAHAVAENYSNIIWDMGDGTNYEGVTEIKHEYAKPGDYVIRVTAVDDLDRAASFVYPVTINNSDSGNGSSIPEPDDRIQNNTDGEDKSLSLSKFIDEYGLTTLIIIGALIISIYGYSRHYNIAIAVGIILLIIGLLHLLR